MVDEQADGDPEAAPDALTSGWALNVKLVGIFNIIAGSLALMWALFALAMTIFMYFAFSMARPPSGPSQSDTVAGWVISGMYGGMALFSVITGAVMLIAGILVLKRSRQCRTWGLVAGFLACASLWAYCLYPFVLAAGIFTLVVLFNGEVARGLTRR
jgi:hypothetical protein